MKEIFELKVELDTKHGEDFEGSVVNALHEIIGAFRSGALQSLPPKLTFVGLRCVATWSINQEETRQ